MGYTTISGVYLFRKTPRIVGARLLAAMYRAYRVLFLLEIPPLAVGIQPDGDASQKLYQLAVYHNHRLPRPVGLLH